MKNKFLPIALVLTLPMVGCATPTVPTAPNGQALSKTDTDFVTTSYDIIQLDDQEGQLAAVQASDPRVKAIATELITKAEALDPKVDEVMGEDNITPPTRLSDAMESRVTRIASLTGKAFDKAYLADQIRSHERGVAVFKAEAATSQLPQMKALASSSLPVVQEDLNKLQAINASL